MQTHRGKLSTSTSVLVLILSLFLISSPSMAANLLTNPGFESPVEEEELPLGWVLFAGMMGQQVTVESGGPFAEGQVLVIDSGGSMNVGMRSVPVPAAPGEIFKASARVYAQPGNGPTFYIDYWNANKQRINAQWVRATKVNEWETIGLSFEAPPGTQWVSVILYSNANQAPERVLWDDVTLEKEM